MFVPAGADDVTAAATSGVWLIGEPVVGEPATVVLWGDVVKTTGLVHSEQAVGEHDLAEVPEDDLMDHAEDEMTFRPWWSRRADTALLMLVVALLVVAVAGPQDVVGWTGQPPLPVLAVVFGGAGLPLYVLCRARIDLGCDGGSAGRFGRRTRWVWSAVMDVQQRDSEVVVTTRTTAFRLPDWPPPRHEPRLAEAMLSRIARATDHDPDAWVAVPES